MVIFYTPDINRLEYSLNEEESKHAIRVLRMGVNDEINMIDGKGTLFKAVVIDPHPKRCRVIIKEVLSDFEKRNYRLHIAISPVKNPDRFEWFLEKATEIGIDTITPLLCDRSEKKNINLERCNRIIESAMKQSIKAYHPKMNTPATFTDFISFDHDETRLIATCEGDRQKIRSVYSPSSEVLILIGPEGDFTDNEINKAKNNQFTPIILGSSRLRTETAGIVACHAINFLNCQY